MALKNLAKGLTIRGLIIDARVLRLLPGETLVGKSVDPPRPPLVLLSEEHAWARDQVKGMHLSKIREELIQRGAPVDGEPWELEASLARLLAENGPQTATRPSAHDSMVRRVDAETRGDAAFAPDTAEGSVRAKYMVALSGCNQDPSRDPSPSPGPDPGPRPNQAALGAKKKAMAAARSLPGAEAAAAAAADGRSGSGWAQVEADLQPGAKEFLLYLERRGMVCALLPSEAETNPKDDGASPSALPSASPSGGFFGFFFGSKQPEQATAGGEKGEKGEEGEEGEEGEREVDTSHEEGEREGTALTKQLQAPPFAHVLGAGGAAGVRRSEPAHILAACAALGLPPGAVMLVSDHARALDAARGARALSCYMLKQVPSAPKRLPSDSMSKTSPIWQPSDGLLLGRQWGIIWCTGGRSLPGSQLAEAAEPPCFPHRSDLVAHDMASLREAVEELNGHSFRDSL